MHRFLRMLVGVVWSIGIITPQVTAQIQTQPTSTPTDLAAVMQRGDDADSVDTSTSSAQTDSLPVKQARDVVISASRWDENLSTVSREITTVTPREVQLRNPSTTADMLGQTGRVFVQKSQLGGGSPMLRGYGANSVLLVMDGVRMNNAIYRGGNLQNSITIDANALEGAEVLYGPGSVQYGSDALGGVMVFRTRQAVFATEGSSLHGTAMLRYGTAMQEKTGTVALDWGGTELASSTVITATDFDDLRGGSVFDSRYPDYGRRSWYAERQGDKDVMVNNSDPLVQRFTGYSQLNVTENLAWKLNDNVTLNYGGIFSTSSNVPRYDRLQELKDTLPKSAEWYYGPQLWTMHTITTKLNDAGALGDQAKISASFQYYNESRNDRRFNSTSKRKQDETVLIGSLNADVKTDLDGTSTLERDLYYGIEAFFNGVTSVATRTDIVTGAVTNTASRYPDGKNTILSGAAYAQARWATSEDVIIAGGVRYTMYDLKSNIADTTQFPYPFTDLSLSTSAFTGSIGATWKVTPSFILHGNASSGFRAPNLDDVAKVFESGPGYLVTPNPNLGPEYVYTAEAGLRWQPLDWLSAEVNGFRSWSIDAIQTRPFTINGSDSITLDGVGYAVYANQNIGRSNIHGVSTQLSMEFSHLSILATGVYQNGTAVDTTIPLSHMPPAYGMVRATWREGAFDAGASFWWNAAKPISEIPVDGEANMGVNTTPDGALPWNRVDLAAGWKAATNLEVRAILENVLDVQYRPYASGVSGPGRNLVVSVRGTW